MLSAEDLGMSYGDIRVWDGLSVSFGGAGLTCIIGPNGVGKSTLMRALDRLSSPDTGHVSLDGSDIGRMPRREVARRVAFVPQGSGEAFSMSVAEAVLMGRHPLSGFAARDRDLEIASRCLRMLGIEDLAGRRLDRLSSGQRQKVLIARGLAQEPDVLLLDEPTSNLDLRHQLEVMRLLRDVAAAEGISIVAICHDVNVAARFADRMVVLSRGRVVADGTPEEVVTPDMIRAVYGVECEVIAASGRPYMVYLTDDGRWPMHSRGRTPQMFKCELNLLVRRRHEVCSNCRL